MQTLAYISCPDIASKHLQATVESYFKPSQWAVIYPSFDQPTSDVAAFEEFKAVIEDEYEHYLIDAELDEAFAELQADPDHRIHRPDDDLADLTMDEAMADEPACGDCGGCCECVGDPEDCRFDTIAERIDFYGDRG